MKRVIIILLFASAILCAENVVAQQASQISQMQEVSYVCKGVDTNFGVRVPCDGKIFISWGDGSIDSLVFDGARTGSKIKNYGSDGERIVTILSSVPIIEFYLSYANATVLDVSQLTDLTWFDCVGNSLRYLELLRNPFLTHVDCSGNQIELLLSYSVGIRCGNNRIPLVNMAILPFTTDFGEQNRVKVESAVDWEALKWSAAGGAAEATITGRPGGSIKAAIIAVMSSGQDVGEISVGEQIDFGKELRSKGGFANNTYRVFKSLGSLATDKECAINGDIIKFLAEGEYVVEMKNPAFTRDYGGFATVITGAIKVKAEK